MARSNYRGTPTRRSPKELNRRIKKKPCALCRDHLEWVDYKDVPLLRKYMSDRGKIRSRRVTGNCAQHQRALALAIKTARELVLLPYTQRTVTEKPGGRGRDRGERTLAQVTPRREQAAPGPSDADAKIDAIEDLLADVEEVEEDLEAVAEAVEDAEVAVIEDSAEDGESEGEPA
jgi:small subunit ribosomal protein S18